MAKLKLSFPTLRQPPVVVFGAGSLRTLADIDDLSDAAVFISGTAAVRERVDRTLARRGGSLSTEQCCVKPAGEPTPAMVEHGAALLRSRRFTSIVAIGGGSVLDWSRLAWARAIGALSLGDAIAFDQARAAEHPSRFCLVPTTFASGAEGATVAVLLAGGRKVPIVSPAFLAQRVILDAHFLDDLSPCDVAASLGDAMSHSVEAAVSLVPHAFAKQLALAAGRRLLEQIAAPPSLERGEALMEGGYLAGIAASHASVGIVHAFAHSLAVHGLGHGEANALGLLAGLHFNAETTAMVSYCRGLGVDSAAAIASQLRGALAPAVRRAAERARPALEAGEGRALLRAAIAADGCLRTNPIPVTPGGIDAFLDRVLAEVGES